MWCAVKTRASLASWLAALGIQKRLERLDEASLGQKADSMLDRVEAGECVCYCSDAGMPVSPTQVSA